MTCKGLRNGRLLFSNNQKSRGNFLWHPCVCWTLTPEVEAHSIFLLCHHWHMGFVLKLVALKQDGCFSRHHSRKKKQKNKKRKTGGIVFLVLKLSLFRSEDFSSHTANFPYFTAQNKCKYKKDWNGEFCFLDSSIDKVKDSEERGTEHTYQTGHLAINIFVYLCYILSSNPFISATVKPSIVVLVDLIYAFPNHVARYIVI